jgi:hypothetical protein
MPDDSGANVNKLQRLDTFETTVRQYSRMDKKQRIPDEGRAI